MNPSNIEELTKALANSTSRRQALKTITTAAIGGLLGLTSIGTAFGRHHRDSRSKPPGGQPSNKDCAHFCAAVFGANTPAAGQCTSDAAHNKSGNLCQQCGGNAAAICCTKSGGFCNGSVAGATCCDGNQTCVGGSCCPNDQACGSVCCPSGQFCFDTVVSEPTCLPFSSSQNRFFCICNDGADESGICFPSPCALPDRGAALCSAFCADHGGVSFADCDVDNCI